MKIYWKLNKIESSAKAQDFFLKPFKSFKNQKSQKNRGHQSYCRKKKYERLANFRMKQKNQVSFTFSSDWTGFCSRIEKKSRKINQSSHNHVANFGGRNYDGLFIRPNSAENSAEFSRIQLNFLLSSAEFNWIFC